MSHVEVQQPLVLTDPGVQAIIETLPGSNYLANYQPTYPDSTAFAQAIGELLPMPSLTSPQQIDKLQGRLTSIATDQSDETLIISGRCAEPVANPQIPLNKLIQEGVDAVSVVDKAFVDSTSGVRPLLVQRIAGQGSKPRSAEYERLTDGSLLPSFMGESINGQAPNERTPDPARMVATAHQARELRAALHDRMGQAVPTAHEALLLPYEMSFMRTVREKRYLLSAELPWIGKRTNSLDGAHVNLLSGIANPIGVKIGPDSTPDHIAGLQTRLNPEGIPGKLIFMFRVGKDSTVLPELLTSVKQKAPDALIVYDIHGVTKTAPTGEKIRAIPEIIAEVAELSRACGKAGLTLHGLHLESIMDNSRYECVDKIGQIPTHPGGVDPQLNPHQLYTVLRQTIPYLRQ